MAPKERQTRLTSDLHVCLAPHVSTYTQTCTHTSKKKLIKMSLKCCRVKQFFVKQRSNVGGGELFENVEVCVCRGKALIAFWYCSDLRLVKKVKSLLSRSRGQKPATTELGCIG